MSASPYFFIEMKNKDTGEWERVELFIKNRKGEFEYADVWTWNGTHDLFRKLGAERGWGEPDKVIRGVHYGLPCDASMPVKKEYSVFKEDNVDAHYVYLSDIYIDTLQNPTVLDYDAMDEAYERAEEGAVVENIYCQSPVKTFFDRVCSYIECWNDWYEIYSNLSEIRIIYWLSW